MDLGSILLSLALFLLVAAFIARPLLDRASTANTSAAPADDLIAQREAILIELRDLDFDHETGKVSDDDYTTQRARLVAKGVEILKALAAVSKTGQAFSAPASLDDEIENAVAARRKGKVARPPASLDHEIENAVATRRKTKTAPPSASHDDEIENAVAARRKAKTAPAATSVEPEIENASSQDRDFTGTSSLAKFCPQCGTAAQPGDKFCAKCGAGLALAPEAA